MEQLGDLLDGHAGRVVKKPGLESLSIESLDQRFELAGRPSEAVHEDDRDAVADVLFSENLGVMGIFAKNCTVVTGE